MSEIIKKFYEENKMPKPILNQKLGQFEKHKDIAEEFEVWIRERTYKTVGAVVVEGYTAKKLTEVSEYLNGDGAFMMLIELRENPKKAHERIAGGFKRK